MAKKLPVMEIFGPTIQGEGLVIGQRTLFIRFGLCDYKCKMCDSMHAVDPNSVKANARWMEPQEIVAELVDLLERTNCGWVTLSGGNPAIHDLEFVVDSLKELGYGISTETQGTKAPDWLSKVDYLTVSPKGPGMGETFEPKVFLEFISKFQNHPGLSVKVVVFDARDMEFASMIAEMVPHIVGTDSFYLSVGNPNPPAVDAGEDDHRYDMQDQIRRLEDILEDLKQYPALKTVRLLPQLHAWVWGNKKGV